MKTKQVLATLDHLVQVYETNGSTGRAELLRKFREAIKPLEKADLESLLSTLRSAQGVDKGSEHADHTP